MDTTVQVTFLWTSTKAGLIVSLDDQIMGAFSKRERTIYLFPKFLNVEIYFGGSVSDRYEEFETYNINRDFGKGVYVQLFTENGIVDL